MVPGQWLRAGLTAALAAICSAPGDAQQGPNPAIIPLTRIGADGSGYLADPQPIRRAPGTTGDIQYLSGTTRAVVRCPYPLRARGCGWRPIEVDAADLRPAMAAAGVEVRNIQNIDIFQDDDGSWQAAVTIGVASAAHPKHWTVVAHAHADNLAGSDGPPPAWTADRLLAGSFEQPDRGNYDGKYYAEAGRLYLLYVRNRQAEPVVRNEIVVQPMASFTQAAGPAHVLLTTGDRYGELNSEQYANTPAKLVEAPWIAVIGGKHALIYSTGSYLTAGYKTAVAWSDTLMPVGANARYRKVLQPDPQNVWGSAGGHDVRYLLQSERPRWPNYVGGSVTGPGVASAVQGPQGAWWLFLNGFATGDLRRDDDGKVAGARRSPFAVRLRVEIPAARAVADASDAELATWLSPAL